MATAQYPSFQPYQSLNNVVPGFDNMLSGASSNVQGNISGLPSASPVQRANAYFGSNSGMPGSDFVRNRGFDLYGAKSDEYKQRGFDNFLQLLRGASGTIAPTTGEQMQNQQFNQNLRQRQDEFNSGVALQNRKSAQDWRSRQPALRDGLTTYNTLGMSPLFGYGSGRY